LGLTLSRHCLKGPSLPGTDDLHVDLLSFHEVSIKNVQIGRVCGSFPYKPGFEVVQEAELYL